MISYLFFQFVLIVFPHLAINYSNVSKIQNTKIVKKQDWYRSVSRLLKDLGF